ncbi:hypothetical protein RJ45_01000, partial [Photobacterium gaetbulicola]
MLPINDLLYVAGAVQPHDITKMNIASYDAGFFGSNSAEWLKHEQQKLNQFAQVHYVRTKGIAKQGRELYAEHAREAAARSDGDNRLVQGRKSPTHPKVVSISSRVGRLRKAQRRDIELVSTESHHNHDGLYDLPDAPTDKRLSTVRLMHREWSGSYRILHQTQTRPGDAPDPQSGDRFTEKLTKRAVTKVFEAAAYVATCHGGFTTFLTLTFTRAQRARLFGSMVEGDPSTGSYGTHTPIHIERNMAEPVRYIAGPYCYIDTLADDPAATVDIRADGSVKVLNQNGDIAGTYTPTFLKPKTAFTITKTAETSIGKEVSRFLDGIKKMFQRGWQGIDTDGEPFELDGIAEPFHYIWVAECPANEHGEPNPHVHLIMNWQVDKKYFQAWSKRLESLWGNGFAHLERIRQPKAAGSYIIKAVGYAAKGENADQGLIKGNRYNIARCSRAPGWDCLANFEAHNMAAIIKECGYRLEHWKKPL